MKKFLKPVFIVCLFSSFLFTQAEAKADPENVFSEFLRWLQPEQTYTDQPELDSCYVDAGLLIPMEVECLSGRSVTISAILQDSIGLPEGLRRIFLLSTGYDMPIEALSRDPLFQVSDTGQHVIRQLIFDPQVFDIDDIELEETTWEDLKSATQNLGGCAIVDSVGATFMVEYCEESDCPAYTGSLEAEEISCYDGRGRMKLIAYPTDPAFVPDGFKKRYILTRGENQVMEAVKRRPQFKIAETGLFNIHTFIYDPSDVRFSEIDWGEETAVEWLQDLGENADCFAWDTLGAQFEVKSCEEECFAESGSLIAMDFECIEDGKPVVLKAITDELPVIPRKYKRRYLLTRGDSLFIESWKRKPKFKVGTNDLYRIHSFVYNPKTLDMDDVGEGQTSASEVLLQLESEDICASLDVEGALFDLSECQVECEADPGTLIPEQMSACIDESGKVKLVANRDETPTIPVKYRWMFLLTRGAEQVIEAFGKNSSFTVDEMGSYAIHTLVYNPKTLDPTRIQLGQTTASDILEKVAAMGTCAALDMEGATFEVFSCDSIPPVDSCEVFAGTLMVDSVGCLDGEMPLALTASVAEAPVIPEGYTQAYVLTQDSSLTIRGLSQEAAFEVATEGSYAIHSFVYDTLTLDLSAVVIDTTTGFDVVNLLESEGICADLDVAGAVFEVMSCDSMPEPVPDSCEVFAGTLMVDSVGCLDGEMPLALTASVAEAPVIPEGFTQAYVLTQDSSLTIRGLSQEAAFEVATEGSYTIHSFVYDTLTLDLSVVVIDTTTGFEVVNLLESEGICADLDVAGAFFEVMSCDSMPEPVPDSCEVFAGTLMVDSVGCLDGEMPLALTASVAEAPVIPEGYTQAYVLTQDSSLTIRGLSQEAAFEVVTEGSYTIHSFVYDTLTLDLSAVVIDTTTGFDVVNLLESEGICADLDVAGAVFEVMSCDSMPEPVPDSCEAFAGTLMVDSVGCLDGEMPLALTASVAEAPVIPEGYSQAFVLTQDSSLTIRSLSQEASFEVATEGSYTIHSLVYDSLTLDLSSISIDTTTGFDVLMKFEYEGICADLDVTGAVFEVVSCDSIPEPVPDSCEAFAGTLMVDSVGCLDGEMPLALTASVAEAPVIPEGYTQAYVLTQDSSLTIRGLSQEAAFEVVTEGLYTIHSLVYDSLTLDLSSISIDTTTGFDVLMKFEYEGICADLDVAGAVFEVMSCDSVPEPLPDTCEAFAGTLMADSIYCWNGEEPAMLTAVTAELPIIPMGSEQLYVLTEGSDLIIRGLSESPSFAVSDTGLYTIHSLVYDTLSLDVSLIDLNTTTGLDVVSLLENEGICADLDVAGASFIVGKCEEFCFVEVSSLKAIQEELCLTDSKTELIAVPEEFTDIPDEFTMMFLLAKGDDKTIVQVNEWPLFTVKDTGTYSIHTFVYQRKEIYLGMIEFGESTIDSWTTFMDDIGACSKVESEGAMFNVTDCDCIVNAGSLIPKKVKCYDGSRSVMLKFSVDRKPVIPRGYAFSYVLTKGKDKVIEEIYPFPYFFVADTGMFAVHTLVYDPDSFNVRNLAMGETTATQLKGTISERAICADLDTVGAEFYIESCIEENDDKNDNEGEDDKEGDSESDSTAQEFKFSDANADFPVDEPSNEYRVYPNPVTSNYFSLTANNPEEGVHMLKLMDINGKEIRTSILEDVRGGVEIDIQMLTNGIYVLQLLRPSGNLTTLKVSIQR